MSWSKRPLDWCWSLWRVGTVAMLNFHSAEADRMGIYPLFDGPGTVTFTEEIQEVKKMETTKKIQKCGKMSHVVWVMRFRNRSMCRTGGTYFQGKRVGQKNRKKLMCHSELRRRDQEFIPCSVRLPFSDPIPSVEE